MSTRRIPLKKLYEDYLFPSATAFQRIGRSNGYTPTEIKTFLLQRSEVQVYKKPPAPKEAHYSYNDNIVLIADLQDFSRWSRQNQGYKWVLNVLEGHSKFAWSFPLKNKEAASVAPHIKEILESLGDIEYWKDKKHGVNNISILFITDEGSEFKGAVSKLLKAYPTVRRLYAVPGRRKSTASVERFNGTLLTMLRRFFIGTQSFKWVDVLPKIVKIYNDTPKRGGKIPSEELQKGYDEPIDLTPPTYRFQIGDWVRTVRRPDVFDKKSITPTLSYKVFQVVDHTFERGHGIRYWLDIDGTKEPYFENELQPAAAPTDEAAEVEKVEPLAERIQTTNRLERALTADLGKDAVKVKRGKVTAVNILPARQKRNTNASYEKLKEFTDATKSPQAKKASSAPTSLILPAGVKRVRKPVQK